MTTEKKTIHTIVFAQQFPKMGQSLTFQMQFDNVKDFKDELAKVQDTLALMFPKNLTPPTVLTPDGQAAQPTGQFIDAHKKAPPVQ